MGVFAHLVGQGRCLSEGVEIAQCKGQSDRLLHVYHDALLRPIHIAVLPVDIQSACLESITPDLKNLSLSVVLFQCGHFLITDRPPSNQPAFASRHSTLNTLVALLAAQKQNSRSLICLLIRCCTQKRHRLKERERVPESDVGAANVAGCGEANAVLRDRDEHSVANAGQVPSHSQVLSVSNDLIHDTMCRLKGHCS